MPHDDSPTLSEMMAMADSPYFDDKPLTNLQRIHELEEMVSNLEEENAKLRTSIQNNCGHWYEPGYGLRCWIPDKWVSGVLGFKPKGPHGRDQESQS
jgi:hypothetical protein